MRSVPDPAALQAGRLAMKRRCIEVALANTPAVVHTIRPRSSLSGMAFTKSGIMCAPRPFTRKSLYIFLHECAHFALNHRRQKPRHVEEMEAEQWAHAQMRAAGIPVPRKMTQDGKRYVARKIRQAVRRGAKRIDPAAKRYAGMPSGRGWFIRWTDSSGEEHRETFTDATLYNGRLRKINGCRWVDSVLTGPLK